MNNTGFQKLQLVLTIVLLIVIAICFGKIAALNSRIEMLNSNLSSQISSIDSQIGNISSNVQYELEAQSSIISGQSFDLVSLNPDNSNVSVRASVTPKTYTAATTASISYSGITVPLTMNGGVFSADFEVAPDTDLGNLSYVQNDGGTMQTQILNTGYGPAIDSFVPEIYANFLGSWDADFTDIDGDVDVNVFSKSDILFNIIDAKIVAEVNDKVAYSEAVELYTGDSSADVPFKPELKPKAGDKVEAYIEITDDNGYIYRAVFLAGTSGSDKEWPNDGMQVYNKDGKLVYTR